MRDVMSGSVLVVQFHLFYHSRYFNSGTSSGLAPSCPLLLEVYLLQANKKEAFIISKLNHMPIRNTVLLRYVKWSSQSATCDTS